MNDHELTVHFEGLDTALANQRIIELQSFLNDAVLQHGVKNSLSSRIHKENSETLDFGATLVMVIGTPAALAIAKGIHDFISKYGNKTVISTPEGTVVIRGDGVKNIDIAAVVAALKKLVDGH